MIALPKQVKPANFGRGVPSARTGILTRASSAAFCCRSIAFAAATAAAIAAKAAARVIIKIYLLNLSSTSYFCEPAVAKCSNAVTNWNLA
jgi:hypothetical protein